MVQDDANYGQFIAPWGFDAKELALVTEYYHGARYHDPLLGIWLSPDPMFFARPGLTPYNFLQNNPIMLWDPTGMLDGGPEKGREIPDLDLAPGPETLPSGSVYIHPRAIVTPDGEIIGYDTVKGYRFYDLIPGNDSFYTTPTICFD